MPGRRKLADMPRVALQNHKPNNDVLELADWPHESSLEHPSRTVTLRIKTSKALSDAPLPPTVSLRICEDWDLHREYLCVIIARAESRR